MKRATHPKTIANLLAAVRNYARKAGLSTARVSTIVFGSGAEFDRISCGGDIGARRVERAMRTIEKLQQASEGAQ